MDKQTHLDELERAHKRSTERWNLAKHAALLLLAVATFLIDFLLGKLDEALRLLQW